MTAAPGNTPFSTNNVSHGKNTTPTLGIIDWEDNFGFSRVDAEFSSNATCGKDAVTSSNGKALEAYAFDGGAINKNVAEIYPNPASDNFKLYLSLNPDQPVTVELSGQDGKLLFSNSVIQSNGVLNIPASAYKPGMYFVRVKQGEFNRTLKVIKQ